MSRQNLEAVERAVAAAVGSDHVLAFMRVTATGRASGIPTESTTGNAYDLVDGKIERIRILSTREQALEAVGKG